ncbi:hypothetical protein BsIDN1_13030 [Bacillus safensis]|uniref:Uncharacterized protein n=1 Tax=Bacillus safensis TaxID=561879 RepID=A0A5S9M4G1_BACIA|nr:hypothetical protein BsIDN1_13030 [Bacillus safensis]
MFYIPSYVCTGAIDLVGSAANAVVAPRPEVNKVALNSTGTNFFLKIHSNFASENLMKRLF